ncbi:MAG TPA: GxxExxY protein [Candidatus Udaeobacter sp.]|nr:GxxExxY protein [Candidatus Udaeobacter sp.]
MNDEAPLFKEEVFQIVGCAIEVLNTLGHGPVEKPYENVLVVEFALRKIPFRQQPPFSVLYKGHTSLRVGVILNFKHAKLQWERIVL